MNFYEADIIKNQQLIKELEENPGRKLKCRKILYEGRIEARKEQLEAWRQGKPFLDTRPVAPCLFRSMGFMDVDRGAAQHGTSEPLRLPPELDNRALKEKGHTMGLPIDSTCGCSWKYAASVEMGTLPLEAVMTCEQYHCPPRVLYKFFMVTRWPNQPFYYFSIPPFENEAALEYLVDQYREFIEVAEKKYPGVIKYDEARLIELQAMEETVRSYNTEIAEMCKHYPSPIAGHEICDPVSWWKREVEYLRAKRDEVAERVAKGFAAVPGEKMRVCWEGSLLNWVDEFEVLAKWGLAVVFWFASGTIDILHYPIPRPAYYGGRKLTPLEYEAAGTLQHMFGGTGAHYIDNLIRICREFKIDAIIDMLTRGGTCNLGFKGVIAKRAEKELGIPTLALECAKDDSDYVGVAEVTAKLDEFARMCLSRKGLA